MIYTFAPTALDADGVCASQTPAGAGNLTINGALAASGVVTLGEQAKITAYSAANISNRTITVTGTQGNGAVISEAITGPNNGTVTTTRCFKTVTQVAISGAAAGAMTIGNSNALETPWVQLDPKSPLKAVSIQRNSTANYTYELQWANYVWSGLLSGAPITDDSLIAAFADATITNKTADALLVVTTPVQAARLKITAFVAGGGTLVINESRA